MEIISVLLVDDDEDMLKLLSRLLDGAGIGTAIATGTDEALLSMRRFKPELIVSDVHMPGTDGYEFCRRVRADGNDDIPFIFLSSAGSLPERIKGLSLGADDYITKPVVPEEFVIRVRLHLEKSRKLHAARRTAANRAGGGVMEGDIGSLSVPDVLQVAASLGRDDVSVEFEHPDHGIGVVELQGSKITHAEAMGDAGILGLQHLVEWTKGHFRVREVMTLHEPTLSGSLGEVLLRALSENDEEKALRKDLAGVSLSVHYTPDLLARRFDDDSSAVLELLEEGLDLQRLLSRSRLSRVQTLRILVSFAQTGVLQHTPITQ